MQYFFNVNPVAFYCSEVHTEIPTTAVPISEEDYYVLREQVNDGHSKVSIVSGKVTVEKVVWVTPDVAVSELIDSICEEATASIVVMPKVKGIPLDVFKSYSDSIKDLVAGGYNLSAMEVGVLVDKAEQKLVEAFAKVGRILELRNQVLTQLRASDVNEQTALSNFQREVAKIAPSMQSETLNTKVGG